jgi:hypothetical protein
MVGCKSRPRAPLAMWVIDGEQELVPLRGKSNCNTLGACSGPQTPPRGSKVACLNPEETQAGNPRKIRLFFSQTIDGQ